MILKQSGLIDVFATARTNCASEYSIKRTSQHVRPDAWKSILGVMNHMQSCHSNELKIGRTTDYMIPSLLEVGYELTHEVEATGSSYWNSIETSKTQASAENADMQENEDL